jgi:hypothetical protein
MFILSKRIYLVESSGGIGGGVQTIASFVRQASIHRIDVPARQEKVDNVNMDASELELGDTEFVEKIPWLPSLP